MSWFDGDYRYRAAVWVNLVGVVKGSTIDVTISVPTDWEHFWTTIQSDGDDIRITDSDGLTARAYKWASFNYANRTGTIEVDNVTHTSLTGNIIWLYYGNSAATSGSSVFTATTPETGTIYLGAVPRVNLLRTGQESPRTSIPSQQIQKSVNEDVYVHWRVEGLITRATAYEGTTRYEEVDYIESADILTGGVSQTAMKALPQARLFEGPDGYTYARIGYTGGSSGTDYTIEISLVTTFGRTITGRAMMTVIDTAEP